MLDTFFSIFWGIILALSILSIPYIIIRYEINRHQDKKKEEQGIYIRRVNRFEAYACVFNPLIPFLGYIGNRYGENMGIWFNVFAIIFTLCFYAFSRYILVAYVKISPEGIEQRIWFSNPTRYPFNAINRVVFYKAAKYEDEDMVGFYAKSGTQIALFSPLPHKNYRLLAIVRFRVENERWPDMDNPDDVAQVDRLDCAGKTMRYFENLGKVTDLADVYM